MAEVTQKDIAAAAEQAGKFYSTQYDYEMDLREAFAAHREAECQAVVDWLGVHWGGPLGPDYKPVAQAIARGDHRKG